MSSHGMTSDASIVNINAGKILSNNSRNFLGNVRVHPIVVAPWFCDSIEIETCTGTKVPSIVFSRNICTPRRSIWSDESDL